MKAKTNRKILLNPGPATTSDIVKYAQIVDDICPREKEFGQLMFKICNDLTEFVGNTKEYTTTLFGGSGTASVEAVLSSIVPENKDILIINNGAYGKRMTEIAEVYGLSYLAFESSPIIQIDLEKLENILISNNNISHLFIVHNETTTGLLNDIAKVGALCEKHKIEMVVDAMSSYASINIDMKKMNISHLCASSNKNIQGMAGVSFVISNIKSVEKTENIKKRNYYLNLYSQYKYFIENKQMRFTPPVQTLYALNAAIDELKQETIHGRYQRYSENWFTLISGLNELGLKTLVHENDHSRIITSVVLDNRIDFDNLHDYLYEKDITIYPGKVDSLNTFRIANIGAINKSDIATFLKHLKIYLNGQ